MNSLPSAGNWLVSYEMLLRMLEEASVLLWASLLVLGKCWGSSLLTGKTESLHRQIASLGWLLKKILLPFRTAENEQRRKISI